MAVAKITLLTPKTHVLRHKQMLNVFFALALGSFGLAIAEVAPSMYATGHYIELAIVSFALFALALFVGGVGFVGYILAGTLGHWVGWQLGGLVVQYLTPFIPLILLISALLCVTWVVKSAHLQKQVCKNNHRATSLLPPKLKSVNPYATQDTPHLLYGMTCCLLFHA